MKNTNSNPYLRKAGKSSFVQRRSMTFAQIKQRRNLTTKISKNTGQFNTIHSDRENESDSSVDEPTLPQEPIVKNKNIYYTLAGFENFNTGGSAGNFHYHRHTVAGTNETTSLGVVYDPTETGEAGEVFKEFTKQQEERIRKESPFGKLKTWGLVKVIVKAGDDLRQEQLAQQVISLFLQCFRRHKLDLWLKPYEILATGPDCGILECVSDAVSLHGIKKSLPVGQNSLLDFFHAQFGSRKSRTFKEARRAFAQSLAGYSLLSYILQIKDRHNGNILMDKSGRLVHIDFGFMLSNSPGGNIRFESAPFKLTDEFEAILNGRRSNQFAKFRVMCVKGFQVLHQHAEQIILLIDMMRSGSGSNLPCFIGGEQAIYGLRARLSPKQDMSEADCRTYVNRLIDESLDNWTTRCYDRMQFCCQNIMY